MLKGLRAKKDALMNWFSNKLASIKSTYSYLKRNSIEILQILAMVSTLFIVGVVVFYRQSVYLISRDRIIHVTDKEEVMGRDGEAQRFIYTDKSTYEVADSHLEFHYYSRDLYGKFEVGKDYKVKVRGIRNGWLSMQPNIVKLYGEVRPEKSVEQQKE